MIKHRRTKVKEILSHPITTGYVIGAVIYILYKMFGMISEKLSKGFLIGVVVYIFYRMVGYNYAIVKKLWSKEG